MTCVARADDVIGLNARPVESQRPGASGGFGATRQRLQPLPWRMLLPRAVANLLVAGRCASMHLPRRHAPKRACFVMGQAAGARRWMADACRRCRLRCAPPAPT
jgi:hypothetical protein